MKLDNNSIIIYIRILKYEPVLRPYFYETVWEPFESQNDVLELIIAY